MGGGRPFHHPALCRPSCRVAWVTRPGHREGRTQGPGYAASMHAGPSGASCLPILPRARTHSGVLGSLSGGTPKPCHLLAQQPSSAWWLNVCTDCIWILSTHVY